MIQAVVKNKVLAFEFILQPFFLYGIGIIDDTPFQVEHVIETPVEEIGAGLFTTDPPRAVHNDVAVLVFL